MATVLGINETLRTNAPSSKIPSGEQAGVKRVMYDKYAYTTNSVLSDVIKFGFLPKGARVLEAYVKGNDWGTVGKIDLGWAASAELDSTGVALEAASSTGFLSAKTLQSTGGDGVRCSIGPAGDNVAPPAGILKSFAGAVQIQAVVNEASNVGTGATIEVVIEYVIE